MREIQLFTKDGHLVTTVAVERDLWPGVIAWKERFFAYRDGRYVETTFFRSDEPQR